jgi:hypothetical protein
VFFNIKALPLQAEMNQTWRWPQWGWLSLVRVTVMVLMRQAQGTLLHPTFLRQRGFSNFHLRKIAHDLKVKTRQPAFSGLSVNP